MKNTGKPSEKIFEAFLDRLGKKACYFRLVDASEIVGRTGKVAVSARAQPSDYMVTMNGETFYAEVKSTSSKTSFPFSMIKPSQFAAATKVIAAGGTYRIFIHRLDTDTWYMIPFSHVTEVMDLKKSSIPWADLENRKCFMT